MKRSAEILDAETGRTLLDWPREAGLSRELRERVNVYVRKKRRRRRTAVGTSVVAFALFACFWGVPYVRDTATVATLPAHRQTLALLDGSHAELNAQTDVHTDFRYGRRIVQLEKGEAFFSVAKDAAHPFLVETPAGTVRVTGTKFNVRLADAGHVEVTLAEGSVLLEDAATRPVLLKPGEQFSSGETAPRTLSPVEMDNVMAWRRGELALDGLSLAEVAARLSAYHGTEITVAPEVAGLKPGGTFPVDNLGGFLQGLQTVLPIRVLTEADGSYRISGR